MEKKIENPNWVFLPVHKSRIIKELDKATLIMVDYNVTTILPKVFRRAKETDTHIFYSLPVDFNSSVRVSTKNEKSRKYEHTDVDCPVQKLSEECELDKPYIDRETEVEVEVGNNVEQASDNLPF